MAKILVADDEQPLAELVRANLASEGHEVVIAEDGRFALKRLMEDTFDLVVLDLMMPWADGFDVLENLTQADLKVVVLTARDDHHTRERAERLGVDAYMTKPYEPERLANEVERLVGPASGPGRMPAMVPMLAYEDASAALDWLADVFGFRERMRVAGSNGAILHAEMELGDGVIIVATPTAAYQSPKRHRGVCEPARRWSDVPWVADGVFVRVRDLDAHYERAEEAGATILSGPEDDENGMRIYRAEDLEGHRWLFAQPTT